MGFWNFVVVVQGFLSTFDLGCVAGATRELPIMRGKNNNEEERKIHSTTLGFTLLQSIIIGTLSICYVYWNRFTYVPWDLRAAIVGIIIFIINNFQLSYTCFFSGAQAFVPLGKVSIWGAIADAITLPLGAYYAGLSGLMGMAILNNFLRTSLFVFFSRELNISLQLTIYGNVLRRLLSFGFFLRLVDYPNALFSMAAVLWVTEFMTKTDLALFSMSMAFFLQLADLSSKAGVVYSMRYLEQGGRQVPRSVMANQLKQYLIVQLLVVVPLLSWAAGVFLPVVIKNFTPKYTQAIPALLVLLICNYFYVINSGLTNPWVLEKRLIARGLANLSGLLLMILALSVSWFILHKQTIIDLAFATLIGYFLYFNYMVVAVGKDMWRRREGVEIILSVSIAAGWTLFILHAGLQSVANYSIFTDYLKNLLFMGAWTLLAILIVPIYALIIIKTNPNVSLENVI